MPNEPLVEIYERLSEVSLSISQYGERHAIIIYMLDGVERHLFLTSPSPLDALLSLFEECYGFRIYDRNVEESNQLQFGRYRVEFWDEDGPMAECIADDYRQVDFPKPL